LQYVFQFLKFVVQFSAAASVTGPGYTGNSDS